MKIKIKPIDKNKFSIKVGKSEGTLKVSFDREGTHYDIDWQTGEPKINEDKIIEVYDEYFYRYKYTKGKNIKWKVINLNT